MSLLLRAEKAHNEHDAEQLLSQDAPLDAARTLAGQLKGQAAQFRADGEAERAARMIAGLMRSGDVAAAAAAVLTDAAAHYLPDSTLAGQLGVSQQLLGGLSGYAGAVLTRYRAKYPGALNPLGVVGEMLNPASLTPLLTAAIPGDPKVVQAAVTGALQVLKFSSHPDARAALPLLKTLRAGLSPATAGAMSVVDAALRAFESTVHGQPFDLTRFLGGALTAMSKEFAERAELVVRQAATDQLGAPGSPQQLTVAPDGLIGGPA